MSLYASAQDIRTIVVDSTKRVSGTPTDFSFDVSNFPRRPWTSVALESITIPKSFYDIGTGYNKFLLTVGAVSHVITITPGTYSQTDFATTLRLALNTASGLTWSVTWSSTTNKFTYSNTAAALTVITFTFGPPRTDSGGIAGCALQMGFDDNSTYTIPPNSVSFTAPNVLQMAYTNSLYLTSNICSTAQDSELQAILNVGVYQPWSFMYLENENMDQQSRLFTDPQANYWNFTLEDEFGFPVDLNGLNFIFTINVYIKDDTDELVKQDILARNLQKLEKDNEDNPIGVVAPYAGARNSKMPPPLTGGNKRFAF